MDNIIEVKSLSKIMINYKLLRTFLLVLNGVVCFRY